MKKTTTLATIVAVTVMGSALCHAEDFTNIAQRSFNRTDTDKSGLISLEEYKAQANAENIGKLDRLFAKIDKDGNGSISIEEWSVDRFAWEERQKQKTGAAE